MYVENGTFVQMQHIIIHRGADLKFADDQRDNQRKRVLMARIVFYRLVVRRLGYSEGGGGVVFGDNHFADQPVCQL